MPSRPHTHRNDPQLQQPWLTRPSSAAAGDAAWSTVAAESTTERGRRPAGRGAPPASGAGTGRAAASCAGGACALPEGPAGSSALLVKLGSMEGAAAAVEVRIAGGRRQRPRRSPSLLLERRDCSWIAMRAIGLVSRTHKPPPPDHSHAAPCRPPLATAAEATGLALLAVEHNPSSLELSCDFPNCACYHCSKHHEKMPSGAAGWGQQSLWCRMESKNKRDDILGAEETRGRRVGKERGWC